VFRGTFHHNIDDKGRVAIPARFREVLAREGSDCIVVTKAFHPKAVCLDVYSFAEWQALEERLAKKPAFSPQTITFKQVYLHPAQDLNVDKQGRILIPPDLRDYAKLKREVVSTGDLEKFQLWSIEEWNRASQDAEAETKKPGFFEEFNKL
jgi:MraZ protein